MAVEFQPNFSSLVIEHPQPETSARPSARAFAPQLPTQIQPESTSQLSVPLSEQQTSVVFRRDLNGQIYYVFTDANTGREIQELPPKQVRAVGQGIADFMKVLEQKNSNRLEVKG
jgi:hypothetical protein